jgi:pyrimidine deaminase RibD-like protein
VAEGTRVAASVGTVVSVKKISVVGRAVSEGAGRPQAKVMRMTMSNNGANLFIVFISIPLFDLLRKSVHDLVKEILSLHKG